MDIRLDEGYMYGLGLFETIAVIENHCVFLVEHISRLNKSLSVLGIAKQISLETITDYIHMYPMKNGALKIMVSGENVNIVIRENIYTQEFYNKGFTLGISNITRNETSPFTYLKSFNYGDNILEKRTASDKGWDEPIFLNTKGHICEGATTNIFFVKEEEIYTPPISSGLLNGILRDYIIKNYKVKEKVIRVNDVMEYTEIFITNSLLGVMPVKCFNTSEFTKRDVSLQIKKEYDKKKHTL